MNSSFIKIFKPFFVTIIISVFAIVLFKGSTSEENELSKYQELIEENYKIFAMPLPQTLDFAGESVPLNLIDVREKLDRELLINTYWQSQTMLFIKRANRWMPVLEPILKENGVPDDFKYLALIESGLTQTVSPAGATGFWQLMRDAARQYGLELNNEIDERYHVEKSTEAACKYLLDAKKKFGSWSLAAASYNMGMSGLNNQLNLQVATNYYDLNLNEETARYLFRILALKLILSDPKSYGFYFRESDLYPTIKFESLEITSSQPNLARYALENGMNYKVLKACNPWLRDNSLNVISGKTYIVKKPLQPILDEMIYDKDQVANFTRAKSEELQSSESGESGE